MRYWIENRRPVGWFVFLFVCLNVGGLVCLAKCVPVGAVMAAHCPMMEQAEHCKRRPRTSAASTKPTDNYRPEAHSTTCFSLPVSVFAAPLEKRGFASFEVAASVTGTIVRPEFSQFYEAVSTREFVYRPPILDLRGNRLQNRVIRI